MVVLNRAICSSKATAVQLILKKNHSQVLCPINHNIITKKSEVSLQQTDFHGSFKRSLHVTKVNRDLEAGLRALGAGAAATAVIGPGIGVGLVFGNLLASIARNPSMANKAFTNAIMGAAFCESLALFALAVGFIIMP